ncbi:MAG: LysR substrate-binding domain-containing protein [Pseudomonas sp.]|uniref:LysR substrate-binding domain-containing protein n=1 Tax=Pseudomonas sp. TaxID=306 RepID=UPI003390A6C9
MSRRLPALYALRAFEAAARHASLTRAAEELALTPSAVSKHVHSLEAYFGCRLFQRQGRQLQLSEAGRSLLPGLNQGFDALEQACASLQVDERELRLKAPPTISMRWLLPLLSTFRNQEPDIEVLLTSAWMAADRVDFDREPFDCAVLLAEPPFPEDWQATLLFAEWLIPVCAPSLVGAAPWSPGQLRVANRLHPTHDRRDWRQWLEGQGLQDESWLRGGQVFDTLELAITAAARGYGVSIGDLVLVAEDVAAGRLAFPLHSAVASGLSYYLVCPRARAEQPKLARLRAFLLQAVAALELPQVEVRG